MGWDRRKRRVREWGQVHWRILVLQGNIKRSPDVTPVWLELEAHHTASYVLKNEVDEREMFGLQCCRSDSVLGITSCTGKRKIEKKK